MGCASSCKGGLAPNPQKTDREATQARAEVVLEQGGAERVFLRSATSRKSTVPKISPPASPPEAKPETAPAETANEPVAIEPVATPPAPETYQPVKMIGAAHGLD